MNSNLLPSQRAAIVGVIDPDANTAATYTSGYVDMSKFGAIQAIIMAGTMATGSTIDAKLRQAQDGSGTGVKDITGKAITQLTEAGTDSDKQAVINCFAEELDAANGFTHVILSMTVGTAASDSGAVILGFDPRFGPASDNDIATVDEIVA